MDRRVSDCRVGDVAHRRAALAEAGLARYEISNYARPGFECLHNLAVWRVEDYVGLGEGRTGASGSCGLRAAWRPR